MSKILIIAAASILLIYSRAFATSLPPQMVYDIQWGNLSLAKSQLEFLPDNQKLQILATVEGGGVVTFFKKFKSSASAQLTRRDDVWSPQKLSMDRISGSKNVNSLVEWTSSGELLRHERSPELDLDKVFPLKKPLSGEVIDPYTATLRVLDISQKTGDCTSDYQIFDGRRHAHLKVTMMGSTTLVADRNSAYSGKAIICEIRLDPLGGHLRDAKWRSESTGPGRIKVFLGQVENNVMLPVRIEVKSWFGTITARLNTRAS